jgi:hypothetical protein
VGTQLAGPGMDNRLWLKRLSLAYIVLFLIGTGFYVGSRTGDLQMQPEITALDIGLSVVFALGVGLVFAVMGILSTLAVFVINDLLQAATSRHGLSSRK